VEALRLAMLGVGVALALTTLIAFRMEYVRFCQEVERDGGWLAMWHERTFDTTDERDTGDGPP
jgi:hypothetical protein